MEGICSSNGCLSTNCPSWSGSHELLQHYIIIAAIIIIIHFITVITAIFQLCTIYTVCNQYPLASIIFALQSYK